MALLLRKALDSGAPPSMAKSPMTPEEVAEAYDEADAEEADIEAEEDADARDEEEYDDEDSEGTTRPPWSPWRR
jgi:hypothetical protein